MIGTTATQHGYGMPCPTDAGTQGDGPGLFTGRCTRVGCSHTGRDCTEQNFAGWAQQFHTREEKRADPRQLIADAIARLVCAAQKVRPLGEDDLHAPTHELYLIVVERAAMDEVNLSHLGT